MFQIDRWNEIWATMSKNKLRTFLTGFSVAWGIFLLIILLGMGNGFQNGVSKMFEDDAINSIWIEADQTTLAYAGFKPGRQIQLRNTDYDAIRNTIEEAEHITSRFYLGWRQPVAYKNELKNYGVRSVHPDHKFVEKTIVTKGRFINQNDLKNHTKVASVGKLVEEELFKGEEAIGKYIKVNGVSFKVVGVFEDEGREREMKMVYLPITTAQRVFNGEDKVAEIMFTVGDATFEESQKITDEVQNMLAKNHKFDPNDSRAVYVDNYMEDYVMITNLFQGIRIFVSFLGICTLFAGIVGVSNIMMVIVKERTREIGIRKAIGASPISVVGLILFEAILITGLAGYSGMVLGLGTLDLLASTDLGLDMFANPTVDVKIAIGSTILLIIAGSLAGLFPALRAARIRPIEALREE